MKVVQIAHNYLPHIGGIELYVFKLIKALHHLGVQVEVFTTDLDTPESNRRSEATYFSTSFSMMRNPFSLKMIRHLLKNSCDILHIHSVWFLPCLMAVLLRKKAKVITTVHGVFPDSASNLQKAALAIYKPCARFVLCKSDKVIVLSQSEKNRLMSIFEIPEERIRVIPNGILIEEYKSVEKDHSVLFTGRINQDKNPDLLIRAAARIRGQFPDMQLVFVGPVTDVYKAQLISLGASLGLSEQMRFVASLDQSVSAEKETLMDYYRRAMVFVALGSWEGLPTRLLEAMQFETPCLTYASGGASELIEDNRNGLVISTLDEVLLAERLALLLSDVSLRRRLGRNARITVLKNYDWNSIASEILHLYRLL